MKVGATLFAVAAASSHPSFEQWGAKYGINANSRSGSMRRNYEDNCNRMDDLNKEHPGATFEVNQFSGMSYEEFAAKFLMEAPPPTDSDTASPTPTPVTSSDASSWCCQDPGCDPGKAMCFEDNVICTSGGPEKCVDNCGGTWCPRGSTITTTTTTTSATLDHVSWPISGIRTQTCPSCWAFAAMAMIESGAISRGAPENIDLSIEEIQDCNGRTTCSGGRPEQAFRALANKSIYTEASCHGKLTGDCDSCAAGGVVSEIVISGYHRATGETREIQLIQALQHDAATVMVDAEDTFIYGWTGILSKPPTSSCSPNHVVLVMGYDFRGDVPYWQIKNSWGAGWAESGTARMARSTDGCGPFAMFKDYIVQADGISIEGPIPPFPTPTPPPPTPPPSPTTSTTTYAGPGQCCQDASCAADTCFGPESFCTRNGPEKCVNNCGSTWCLDSTTTTTTPVPAGWCCQDPGCAVDTCFDDSMFCTQAGPEKCVENCGGTWCSRAPTPTPSPTPTPTPTTPTTTSTKTSTTTPKPTPKPPANPQCCWSNWGDADSCGRFPQAQGGRCNTDWSKSCVSNSECGGLFALV